jgi:16S rRNA (guanine527-N7)-methyltransferase
MSAADALAAGLASLGLALDARARDKLLAFVALIHKWNRVYNLTAIRDPEKMVAHHLLDSLAVVPHLHAASLLDVGSGAGLPGIPIALACPQTRVTLLEANHKKSAFLQQAVIELALGNASVVNARVEALGPSVVHDVVISRAFADLGEFATLAGHLVGEDGVLAAMKGVYPYEELAQLPPAYRVAETIALDVPGLEAERHLVLIRRQQ